MTVNLPDVSTSTTRGIELPAGSTSAINLSSTLLAREVLPYFPGARLNESLRRIRPTRVQSKLADRKERLSNVVGAFAVDLSESFDGRTVLLIDDVVSTGGTVSECASALNRAGAARVDVLAAGLPVAEADRKVAKR